MKEQIDKAELQQFVITLSDCQHKYDKEVNKAIVTRTPLPKENKFYARYLTEQGYRKQKEGEWVWTENGEADCEKYWVCSACKEHDFVKTKYCPNCGAKMKGGAE